MTKANHLSASDSAVKLKNIVFRWPGADSFSIAIENFGIKQGEMILLLGPSGGGKSTLLSLLTGIVTPQQGEVVIGGTITSQLSARARDRFRAEHFGIIFQMFNLLPYGSAIDNVTLPLNFAPKRKANTQKQGGTYEEAVRLLTELELEEKLHHCSAAKLSVGQQQRVAAARALIGSPPVIIADEPTSALDRDRQVAFLKLLKHQLEQTRATMLMVSHDDSLASQFTTTYHLDEIITRA